MLTKEERISISKKIVSEDLELAAIDATIAAVAASLVEAQRVDSVNRKIQELEQPLIDAYQVEIQLINGQGRTSITETDILNSANRVEGNYFFPNDLAVVTPNVPSGRWLFLPPFLLSLGIGKDKTESYVSILNYENVRIPELVTAINDFLSTYTNEMERVTGQQAYEDPGPPPLAVIATYTALRDAADELKSKIMFIEAILNDELTALTNNPDTNAARLVDRTAALASLNTALTAITTWKAYEDWNTAHGQTTVAGFYSYNPALLYPTKYQIANITAIRDALSTRLSFAGTRAAQISGYLGNITQGAEGEITSTTGMYGRRGAAINLRLNLIGGSLQKIIAIMRSSGALDEQKNMVRQTVESYETLMTAIKLESAANGTSFLNLLDASAFAVGDKAYIVSDSQEEIELVVQEIVGNRIRVNKSIPAKYRESDLGRVYKLLA